MDIVARLREEQEALVARLTQIDKMLKQHEEWGQEARRLLSLTPTPQASVPDDTTDTPAAATSDETAAMGAVQPQRSGGIRFRKRTLPAQAGGKTPMPEFEAAVVDVLRNADQPMDRVALYDALTARGIVIGSGTRDKDLNALSARVYRMAQNPGNRISGERGQGYRLVDDDEVDASASTGEPEVSSTDDDDLI